MSQTQSHHNGKRSLMSMVNSASQKTASASSPNKKRSSSTPKKTDVKIEFRDGIMSPNTRQLTASVNPNKIFNDSVHTHITLEPVCVKIVDTPQYQRLHGLKQLGTCDFVFRGATHTRFEHSLGVAHMAARVVRTLRNNQPELGISEMDVLCVKIAGLCHDLGHGPFSHVFDGEFIRKMHPKGIDKDKTGKKWRHEDGSVQMFRFLLTANDIQLEEYGLQAADVTFIEEIISGTKEGQRRGRARDKFFLYDVVNNARSGLDVDKLDYFQRDMARSGVSTGSSSRDFDRFIELAVVMPAEPIEPSQSQSQSQNQVAVREGRDGTGSAGEADESEEEDVEDEFPLMICYPEKMVRESVTMFATRFNMHQLVYTHKSVKQVEYMVTDALQLADEHLRIQGDVSAEFPLGKYKMSETIYDMRAFMAMKDSILDIICHEAANNPLLEPARDLITRIHTRKLYICIGKAPSLGEDITAKSEEDILQEILAIAERNKVEEESFRQGDEGNAHLGYGGSGYVELTASDLIVEKMRIHYGMGKENPVNRMRFFQKHATSHLSQLKQQKQQNGAPIDSSPYAQDRDRPQYQSQQQNQPEGKRIDESLYETVLPRVFEDRAVRLFCRNPEKAEVASAAFKTWCNEAHTQAFPSLSQSQGGGENSQLGMFFDEEEF